MSKNSPQSEPIRRLGEQMTLVARSRAVFSMIYV
jgi:hypothetical protein